ncbi:Lamina-associated polypeptide 2, isoform alpha [Varanus komodoensis]|nr:Lamina-associated polypeptide 2, isoform alpha [Varanus komodoensis]
MAQRVAFHKCRKCGSKMPAADPHDLCLLCLEEGHRTDKCNHCLAFSKQTRNNRENCIRKLLWDQALLQSDWLVAKPSTVVAPPEGRPTSADLLQRSASSSIAPPSRPSEEGAHAMANQSVSLPKKQKEKRKHSDSDKYPVQKKAKKDKMSKPVKKPKNPEQAKHRHLGSASSSIPIPTSEPTPSVPTIQAAMRVTPLGSLRRPAAEPHYGFEEGVRGRLRNRTYRLDDLMARLVRSLDKEAHQQPGPSTDRFYDVVRGERSTSIAFPFIMTLRQAMTQPWDLPANPQPTSRKYESMYRVREEDIPFLLRHPKPNSVVVESSRGREARGHTSPRDKEGRKVDSLARQVYAASGLGLRISNYEATLARYQYFLMQRLDAIIDTLPGNQGELAKTFVKEAMQVAVQQLSTARHHVDSDSRSLVGAVSLRRHAWLRNCNFPDKMKRRIEEMPFNGSSLFHARTDSKLKKIHESRMTAHCMELQSVPRQGGRNPSPRFAIAETDCMEDTMITSDTTVSIPQTVPTIPAQQSLHPDLQYILESVLRPSARKSYAAKWQRFSNFANLHSFLAASASFSQILQFLFELHQSGLKPSSIKVYTAAISHYRGTIHGLSIFAQPLFKRFLRGLSNLHPTIRPLMPTWSLSVVLQALTRPTFELMATIDLRLASWKTAFLVAVTSAVDHLNSAPFG